MHYIVYHCTNCRDVETTDKGLWLYTLTKKCLATGAGGVTGFGAGGVTGFEVAPTGPEMT